MCSLIIQHSMPAHIRVPVGGNAGGTHPPSCGCRCVLPSIRAASSWKDTAVGHGVAAHASTTIPRVSVNRVHAEVWKCLLHDGTAARALMACSMR